MKAEVGPIESTLIVTRHAHMSDVDVLLERDIVLNLPWRNGILLRAYRRTRARALRHTGHSATVSQYGTLCKSMLATHD